MPNTRLSSVGSRRTARRLPFRGRAARAARATLGTLDRFDLGVLACLFGLSLAFLAWVVVHGGVFGGWEGFVVADQGQYLSWIRESGEHVLIANRFDMRPDAHVFLYPPLLASGLLYDLGLSAPLAYLLWKPVGVLVLFLGAWRYTRRMLAGLWERRAALVLALLFVPPASVLSPLWGGSGRGTFDFISGEIWPAGHLWGYPMTAVAVGLTALVFLSTERALRGAREAEGAVPRRRERLLAAAAALLVSWVHPWQGALLIGVLCTAALWEAAAGRAGLSALARVLWPVLTAAALPAIYYFVLPRTDASWSLSEENYRTALDATMTWRAGFALAPLGLPALLAYRRRAGGFQERVLRLWAPLGFALYLLPPTPVRFHAFNGLSIPLAILAVRGVAPYLAQAARNGGGQPARRALIAGGAVAACALLVVPGAIDRIRSARAAVYLNQQPFHLAAGERDALSAIERASGGGGVMTSVELAALVPYRTGHETWVATPSWSPDFGPRAAAVSNLLEGRFGPQRASRLVRSSGVRFVLRDCRAGADLSGVLAPLGASVRRYGCATLYELPLRGRQAAP